jgi:hypothetical protein
MTEAVEPLVNCQERRFQKLVQEERERRFQEHARTRGNAVQERKTWRKRSELSPKFVEG